LDFFASIFGINKDTEARQMLAGFNLRHIQVAGAVGIEPTTFGFGDRRSAN
jgi:hypothetical protein